MVPPTPSRGTATAGTGNPLVLSIDSSATSVCTISGSASGSTVSFTAAGTCKIDANQAASTNYSAATQVQQSFTVAKGTPTTAITSYTTPITYGGETSETFTVTVTGPTGGATPTGTATGI